MTLIQSTLSLSSDDDFSMGPEAKRRSKVGTAIFPQISTLTPFDQSSSSTTSSSAVSKSQKKPYTRKSKFNKRRTEEERDAAKPLDYNHLVEEIKVACTICMGGAQVDALPNWEQEKVSDF